MVGEMMSDILQNVALMEIPGLGGRYSASDDGRIWSHLRNKFMTASISNGYPQINICLSGQKRRKLVHRLVASAWIKNPNNLPQVNHINGIKTDNRSDNLEWCDASYQRIHAMQLGLVKTTQALRESGKINGKSRRKLTYEQAEEIRSLDYSLAKTALLYGVSKRCIHFIKQGKTYVER
jgi:hypothetical protein